MARDADDERAPHGGAAPAGLPAWATGESLLELLATRSPVGIVIVDSDLRCVWSNTALEQFGGGTVEERLGRRLGEIHPELDAQAVEARMQQVLETGKPLIGYIHMGRTTAEPQLKRALSLSFVRLEDHEGRPLGVLYSVTDITPRQRARLRLALLDRAGRYIGRSLNVLQTAQEVTDVAVPELADFVTVDLLDAVCRGGETPSGRLGAADVDDLRRSGQRAVDDNLTPRLVPIGGTPAYQPWSPPVQCLTRGMSWREARLDPLSHTWITNGLGGPDVTFRDLGLHTAMVVPVRARGATLGITCFFRRGRDEPFDDDDLRLAVELVDRAAVSIDNARRYTRERNAALMLQRSLLPPHVPKRQAVDVASHYRPAEKLTDVGGDWFDVIPLSGARVGLVVGDVVGHGIEAAAAMGRLRTTVRALADLDLFPEELLARLDDSVSRGSEEAGAATVGATCLYAVYDPVTRKCAMASAGHPPPAVVLPDGAADFPDVPLGPALGTSGLPFEAAEWELAEDSVLVLYTDGLLAAGPPSGSDTMGREQLRRALEEHARSASTLDALCEETVDALLPAQPVDDATLLLARTHGLNESQYASWDVPTDPASVARTRTMVGEQLARWGLDDMAFTTELVASELLTNAIRHAAGPVRLRLLRDLTLICEVSDASSTSPHLRHARTTDEGGRGLFLISQFTERWGTRYTPEGKIIWAEQPLPDPL